MTGRDAGHSRFDELAAGYALDALEPAEEQSFLAHAEQCPYCRRQAAAFREVAGALAEVSPPAQPGDQLGGRILAAMLADADQREGTSDGQAGAGDTRVAKKIPGAPVVSLRDRRARGRRAGGRRKLVPVAAAAALVAGGGIWAGLAATAGGSQPPLAACARSHACAQVQLTAIRTGRTAATVIVRDGVAWMEPAAMPANPADEVYVLWQITATHTPVAVGSFDIRPGLRGPVRIGDLAVPYSGTSAFAVSLEHGRTIPASPSRPIAQGEVS